MTKLRKFGALALAAALLASTAACGGSGGSSSSAPAADNSQAAPAADAQTPESKPDETPAPAASGDKKVVTFFHRWPNEPKNPIFTSYVQDFMAANPDVEIQMDCVLNDSYKEKVRVLVSGDSVPDVFSSWSGSFAENLVSSGNVLALDDMLAADPEFKDSFIESQIEPFTFDGKIYGLPMSMDGKAFFYNKDAFDANGLSVPATLDDLYAALDTLKGAGYETPLIEGLADAWAVSHYEGTIISRLLDPAVMAKDTNKSTGEFTDPAYIEALNIFKKLTEYMGEAASALDHETARNMFVAGEVPLIYCQLAEIRIINGETSLDAGGGPEFEYDFFNFPAIAGGKGDQTGLTGAPEGFMLSTKAANPDEAQAFFKYILSVEAGEKMTKEAGEISAVKGAVNENSASPEINRAVDMILGATSSVPWYDNAVEASIGDAFMRGGQSLAIGDMTAEEVMADVQNVAAEVRAANP